MNVARQRAEASPSWSFCLGARPEARHHRIQLLAVAVFGQSLDSLVGTCSPWTTGVDGRAASARPKAQHQPPIGSEGFNEQIETIIERVG
jgi:hypothetical protein